MSWASTSSRTICPVSNSPSVEALTRTLLLLPKWLSQSAFASLSRIIRSRVSSIGDSEKCLGQVHQNNAFLARQRGFTEKGIEPAYVVATLARFNDQLARPTENIRGFGLAELCPPQQRFNCGGFIQAIAIRHHNAKQIFGCFHADELAARIPCRECIHVPTTARERGALLPFRPALTFWRRIYATGPLARRASPYNAIPE